MSADRNIYAVKAIRQIPRLLSNLDRNPYSPSYGSFDRGYWHDKASDFSDADRQFGVHALALLYKYDFPGNPFKGQPKIRDWVIAAMEFWARTQHSDGSFDEHYPFERGWVGPTAFSTYTCCEALRILGDEVPAATADRVRPAIRRAAVFISAGQAEEDHLANHHALACLAVWKAYELLKNDDLQRGYDTLWQGFLRYHDTQEGWSREYDGPDLGYLSATVSFLAKIYVTRPDPRLLEVLKQSAEFCSYFVYPDGSYAGSVGSRGTLHFYPHGFELLAKVHPPSAAVAEKMLQSLGADQGVPPEIMPDRYMAYRLPEYLLAYQDYAARPIKPEPLPYEREPFRRYFNRAGIYVANEKRRYLVANLAKGGVVKVFDKTTSKRIFSDSGILARLINGELVTSQWINPRYQIRQEGSGWDVSGHLQGVPVEKRFTPLTYVLFRATLLLFGRWPGFSHWLKGKIRQALILSSKEVPIRFHRTFSMDGETLRLTDELRAESGAVIAEGMLGGEFAVRHVPQSRYFQLQDLETRAYRFSSEELEKLKNGELTVVREINAS